MEKRRAISSLVLIVLAAFFWLLPSVGQAVTVDCDTGGKIQDAIDAAEGRTLIDVSGTCNENVYILEDKNRITLDGGGVAIINGPDATLPTLSVRGRGIEIRNFNITGGTGIEVCRGGTATRIENNIIENTRRDGISVFDNGFAIIVNNTIQHNPGNGIGVGENSAARIGFASYGDLVASPNTIQNNGGAGIIVIRSSSATIVGNIINDNVLGGVGVSRAAYAEIANNTINNNGENGILVFYNSGVHLGKDTGTGIFDLANTTTVKNTLWGIKCGLGGYVDGRRGSLKGKKGRITVGDGCIDSTIP